MFAKSTKKRLAFEHTNIPVYPYGSSSTYKQSNFGLYGAQKIRFGNTVSEKNEIKTRRYWRPNVHFKRLWSDALETFVRLRTTTRVLRTVDKVGGLDEYLLGEKAGRVKELGMEGWKLRWRVMQTEKVKERLRVQREHLGLPPLEEVLVGNDGKVAKVEDIEMELTRFDEDIELGKGLSIREGVEERGLEDGFMQEERPHTKDNVEL